MTLEESYRVRHDSTLVRIARSLELLIRNFLEGVAHIDRVSARPKSPDRFLAKAQKEIGGIKKYSHPLVEIQDQIGARIIVFYLDDVIKVSSIIARYFRPVEEQLIVPDSPWEFGYSGKHYIMFLPDDVIESDMAKDTAPKFFELQIKTLFQHAWSEAEHDLGYKPGASPLTNDQERQLAFTAAQSWGADRIFNELYSERHSTELSSEDGLPKPG